MSLPIEKAVEVVKQNLSEVCTVQEWADVMGFKSSRQFSKNFRDHYGVRPSKKITQIKIERVKMLINESEEVKHFIIANEIGLPDEQALYKFMKYHTGQSPSGIRQV
ncbi:MAG: helix-turn-helix transcriptional regulator [Balneolaceae bacterium]|nr:helix-turn-helix transcriptional regulator [Balneolaceae bacterium]